MLEVYRLLYNSESWPQKILVYYVDQEKTECDEVNYTNEPKSRGSASKRK